MVKETVSLKVLEIAIKKRDFPFLSRKLLELLRKYDWNDEEVRMLTAQIEEELGR